MPKNTSKQTKATMESIRHTSSVILVCSGIGFAAISLMAIWDVIDAGQEIIWKSLTSLAVIALTSLIVNIGAKIYGNHS